jgi:hypothetical protein
MQSFTGVWKGQIIIINEHEINKWWHYVWK